MTSRAMNLRRALALLLPCLATVLAAVLALWCWRETLSAEAKRGTEVERLVQDARRWATTARPEGVRGVVFGDSLTMSLGLLEYGRNQPGVAALLRRALRAEGIPVDLLRLTHPSFRPVHFAYFLDDVLAGRPRFVVTDVNLRLIAPTWQPSPGMHFRQLSRGLSTARHLALWRSLRDDGLGPFDPTVYRLQDELSLLYATDGLRITMVDWLDAQAVRLERLLGLDRRRAPAQPAASDAAGYASDLAGSPSAAILARIDRELAAAGVWTLYYVSPLNPDVLGAPDMPSPDVLRDKIESLRAAIGVPRERWLDLHAALPASDFLDRENHLRPSGLQAVVARLLPRLRPTLAGDGATTGSAPAAGAVSARAD